MKQIETTSRKNARKHSRQLIALGFTVWIVKRESNNTITFQVIGEK